jgi:hypothetical protein
MNGRGTAEIMYPCGISENRLTNVSGFTIVDIKIIKTDGSLMDAQGSVGDSETLYPVAPRSNP